MKSEEIKLFGNSEDIIRFDYKCEECDNCGTPIRNAPECSNEGMLVCGGCSCNPGRKGTLFKNVLMVHHYNKRTTSLVSLF